MPRAKEFDEAEVLDKALGLFRARGFSQTSFSDLTVELGVNRQSLYDTYGDKQTLYQTALKRYSERGLEMMERKLDDSRPVRTVLSELFQGIISSNCDCGSPGCLMVNSMVEMAPHDEEVKQLAHDHFAAVEALLTRRFELAQKTGEVSKTKDPASLARFFRHTVLGLSVASRAFGEKEGLKQTAALALQILD